MRLVDNGVTGIVGSLDGGKCWLREGGGRGYGGRVALWERSRISIALFPR